MSEKTTEVSTIEDAVTEWTRLFEDLNDGGDTRRWQRLTIEDFAPAALFGQDLGNGIAFGPVIEPGEQTVFAFPCFIDDDPVEAPTPAGTKIKFRGKARQGAVLITDRAVKVLEHHGHAVSPISVPLDRVRSLNPVQFKFSLFLSMTSAGPGFELFLTEPDGSLARVLVRVALTPRDAGAFEARLRSALGLAGR